MNRSNDKNFLKWYIREWREHKGLTQDRLAELLDTNRGQISKLERGELRMNDTWIKGISSALQISPADLLIEPAQKRIAIILDGLLEIEIIEIHKYFDFLKSKRVA